MAVIQNSISYSISGTSDNDTIYNGDSRVTINANGGDDYIDNYGSRVTINANDGDDYIYNYGSGVTINAGDGNDSVKNIELHVIIDASNGDDYVYNIGNQVAINTGDGDDTILNNYDDAIKMYTDSSSKGYIYAFGGYRVTIDSGNGNDKITNFSDEVNIFAGEGNDYIINHADYGVTIDAGDGDDHIFNGNGKALIRPGEGNDTITLNKGHSVIEYESIDDIGNDVVQNLGEHTIRLLSGKIHSASVNGNDVIVKIGKGSITLKDKKNQEISIVENENPNIITFTNTYNSDEASDDSSTVGDDGYTSINSYGELVNTKDNVTINGTEANDNIINSGKNVWINGLAGDDIISNVNGRVYPPEAGENVTINGGLGDDEIFSNSTDHIVYADGDGNDTVYTYDGETIHITSGIFKGASPSGTYNENVVVTIGGGSITLEKAKDKEVKVIDSTGKTNIFKNNFVIKPYAATIGANETFIADVYNNFVGASIKGANGAALIEAGDTLTTDSQGNINMIRISDKSHHITTPNSKYIIEIKDYAGNSIANIIGAANISWNDKDRVVIEAADKNKSITVESFADNVDIIGSTKADNISNHGKNTNIDSDMGNDKIINEGTGTTIVGGLDNDTINGDFDILKLNSGSVKNASLNGSDVIITTSTTDNVIRLKNAKGKPITVISSKDKKINFTDTYSGDPDILKDEAQSLCEKAYNLLEAKVKAAIQCLVEDKATSAFDTLKGQFDVISFGNVKLSDIPPDIYEHISKELLRMLNDSKCKKMDVTKNYKSIIDNAYQMISQMGTSTEPFKYGKDNYKITYNSLIAGGTGLAVMDIKKNDNDWVTLSWVDDENGSYNALKSFISALSDLNEQAWWKVITGLIQDLTGTTKVGRYVTYAKNILQAIMKKDTYALGDSLLKSIKDVIARDAVDWKWFRTFIENKLPYGKQIMNGAEALSEMYVKRDKFNKESLAAINDVGNELDDIKKVYRTFEAVVNANDTGDITKIKYWITDEIKNLFNSLSKTNKAAETLMNSSAVYMDQSGNTTSSKTNAAKSLEISNNTIIYSALKEGAQKVNLGSENDEMDLIITTSKGNDSITTASSKNTTINSGAGNDSIQVKGLGDAYVNSGLGNDYIHITSVAKNTINAGKGNDTIDVSITRNEAAYIENNDIENNTSNNNSSAMIFQYASGDGNDVIQGYDKNDTIQISSGTYSTNISGNDILVKVDSGSIRLKNAKGTKLNIKCTATLDSSSTLTLTNSDFSSYTAESKIKNISASSRTKSIKIKGNSLANSILGGSANDSLNGDDGDDTLNGGKGDDSLTGGNGNDVFIYASGQGNDVITDYKPGQDKIKITGKKITSASLSGNDVILKVGIGSIKIKNGKGKTLKIYNNTNSITDTIISFDSDSTITSGKGKYVENINNRKVLTGASGNDTIDNVANYVTINSGAGNDSIVSWGDNIKVNAGAGNDKVHATGKKISILGGDGNDSLNCAYGYYATINGGKGNDTLSGSYYADVFQYANGDDNDVIYNYDKSDKISLSSSSSYSTMTSGQDIIVKVGSGKMTLKYAKGTKLNIVGGKKDSDINTDTGKGENISNSIKNKTITGTNGNDSISNEAGGVKIYGKDGNDSISNNIYIGYTVKGSFGYVTIDGGVGKDTINNFDQNVSISGGAGNDYIYNGYGYVNEYIYANNVTIKGGAGNDTITKNDNSMYNIIQYASGDGNDIINGYNSSDTIQISGSSYSTQASGNNVIIKVGSGQMTLKNAKGITLNITGTSNYEERWFLEADDNFISSDISSILKSDNLIADDYKLESELQFYQGNELESLTLCSRHRKTSF